MCAGRESSYMPDMTRKRAFRISRSRTGLGLFATAPIKKGAFIVEYKGRKLTTEQADKLEARGNRYLYVINSRWRGDPDLDPAGRRRGDRVKRREFITLLGGAAATASVS